MRSNRLVTIVVALFVPFAAAACRPNEQVVTVAGPPLTVVPSAAAIPRSAPDADGGDAAASPLTATFVELYAGGAPVAVRACDLVVIAVTKGRAFALGDELRAGDELLSRGVTNFELKGNGAALVATMRPTAADCAAGEPRRIDKQLVRADKAPALVWADGRMRAHLDAETAISPLAYVGRLEGTAPVAEHAHAGSWEILAAIDGAGTFTVNGVPRRVAPRTIVMIPPGTKHAWLPDDAVALRAIQFYVPPGPEQRFKLLAGSAASDAGSSDSGANHLPSASAPATKMTSKPKPL